MLTINSRADFDRGKSGYLEREYLVELTLGFSTPYSFLDDIVAHELRKDMARAG